VEPRQPQQPPPQQEQQQQQKQNPFEPVPFGGEAARSQFMPSPPVQFPTIPVGLDMQQSFGGDDHYFSIAMLR